MDNFRNKRRKWRSRRQDDQQFHDRGQIHWTRMDDTLKVVLKKDSCQRQVIDNNYYHWPGPKHVKKPIQDRFHWSKPKRYEDTTNKQNSNVKVHLSPDKKQTKADISQLAGFLKKRSISSGPRTTTHTCDVINKPGHTCCVTPVNEKSSVTFSSSIEKSSGFQDSVRCDRTAPSLTTKLPCVKADREKSVGMIEGDDTEDDFDYSLDLMGDYILDTRENTKEPSPSEAGQPTCRTLTPVKQKSADISRNTGACVSVSQTDTNLFHYFTPEIDFALNMTPDNGEYDLIMNSRRGYTYINSSRHRGVKRRIAYDEDQKDSHPCKRLRTC